mgnify:FL=1
MLSKPKYGWSDFQLEGTAVYSLSCLDDSACEWLEQAIHGLETLMPFCVKGFMEPERFLCLVSYWNCHIICEDDESEPLAEEEIVHEVSHTSMLQFCQQLYDDISKNIDEWVAFADYRYSKFVNRKRKDDLPKKLTYLKKLISKREQDFSEGHGFL